MTSWAANWSPDNTAPRGFKYPINLDTGMVDEKVLAQWVAKTPHGLLRDPAFVARVKKHLSRRIMIIVGRNDEFDLFAPAECFAREQPPRAFRTCAPLPPRGTRSGPVGTAEPPGKTNVEAEVAPRCAEVRDTLGCL
jgi:hypothetical protein